jgi:hypothetical protein
MSKPYLINSAVAALTTAFLLSVSLSSANAGWGPNGEYGNTPGQTQSTPAKVPAQTGGYGGGQSGPTGSWGSRPSRPAGSYGSNNYPNHPCRRCDGPYMPSQTYEERPTHEERPTYEERPTHGTVYLPPNRRIIIYLPPHRGTVYVPPSHGPVYGGGYGGSHPLETTTGSWNSSGGYGGR